MLKLLYIFLIQSFFLISNSFASLPLVIDTDAGWDDWIAVSYILNKIKNDDQYECVGIVVNGIGEAHLEHGINNIRKVIALSGQGSKIPVYAGSNRPLKHDHRFPENFRKSVDNLFGIQIPNVAVDLPITDGKMFLKHLLTQNKEKVTILAIGGLTSVGEIIKENPKLSNNIERIFIMGGVLDFTSEHRSQSPHGNIQDFQPSDYPKNKTSEWNIFIDPVAADIVFKNIKNITMVPLNACRSIPLNESFLVDFKSKCKTPLGNFINKVLVYKIQEAREGNYQEYFYDPLTAAIALGYNNGVVFRKYPVYIETKNPHALGTTYISDTKGNEIDIVVEVDPKGFKQEMIDVLCRTSF